MVVSIVGGSRWVIALVLGIVLVGLGTVGGRAQQATPVVGDAHEPVQAATLLEANEEDQHEATATLVINLIDGEHQPVPGACMLAELESGTRTELCDGRDDGSPDGTITFHLPPGSYLVVVSQPPQGYAIGPAIPQLLSANHTSTIDYQLVPGGRDVFINSVDEQQSPVLGACVTLFADDGSGRPGELVSAGCDSANGEPADGSIAFRGIVPGSYIVVQASVPDGYAPAAATPFTVPEGGTGPFVVTMVHGAVDTSGDLKVVMVDGAGDSLMGACADVYIDAGDGEAGDLVAQQCDADDGASDGALLFTELDPGTYVVVERVAPAGYVLAEAKMANVTGDVATTVSIAHTPGGSDVTVRTVDANSGALIRGACIVVVEDDGGDPTLTTPVGDRCDDADGSTDGLTVFAGLPGGSYALWERIAPETYKAVETSVLFSVDGITNTTVTVENVPMTLVEQLVEVLIEILDEILNG